MTVAIHFVAPEEMQNLARLGVPVNEWDVKTINGTFIGVVETCDDGFMYTDSFGHLTTFFDGETLMEVTVWVNESVNQPVLN